MCGIVGYIGNEKIGLNVVLAGLRALEYRGYDSAGAAYVDDKGDIVFEKQIGRVDSLAKELGEVTPKTATAIGHTRWATHGSPSTANAHPHFNADGTIMVVHNGIIENYAELKDKLQAQGYSFVSETDTEVIPHLLDYYAKTSKDFEKAFQQTLAQLQGAYGLLVMTAAEPDKLYTARLGSPLVFGVIPKSGAIVASDPVAIQAHTKEVVFLNDYEYAVVERNGAYRLHDLKAAKHIERATETLDYDASEPQLGDFPHFMLKEIFEIPQAIQAATLGRIKPGSLDVRLGGLEDVKEQLRYIDRIVVVACGTAYYAALAGEYLIEEIAGIPVEVQLASEFKYRNEPFSRSTALIAVSQSGETADTIAALKKVESYGVLRLGIVNAVGSTIARITDAGVYCHAGPERAVASTKAFMAQVTVFTLLALYLSNGKTPLYKPIINELLTLPSKAAEVLEQNEAIKKLALKYENYRDFLYIGRGYGYPCALEGAIKLKEVSYVHAEGYAAGEMKHGPLAMIDPNFPTFAIATKGDLLDKTFSNIEEIRARKGPVVAVGTVGHTKDLKNLVDDLIEVPKTIDQFSPLLATIVSYLFAYHVATAKGYDVDHPRNLAKAVTVE